MGWASAGEIFDPVAEALIDANAPAALKRQLCTTLIRKLQDSDWDTESESLDQFRHDPAIVAAFYQCDIGNELNDDETARITWRQTPNSDNGQWHLICDQCGPGAIAENVDTALGHNNLLRVWLVHGNAQHGYTDTFEDVEHMTIPETP